MGQSEHFAAELLETSASGYAALATDRLMREHPALAARFSPDAAGTWKAALGQRIVELASALRLGEPALFSARVTWARRAFAAREVPAEDLRASLRTLADVLSEELPEAVRHGPANMLETAIAVLDQPEPVNESAIDVQTPHGKLALEYLATVLEGDSRKGTDLVLQAVAAGVSVEDAYLEVLVPAQREIGRLWHAGELGIAEEHVVTSTTERLMALLSHNARRAPVNGRTVICAAVSGNAHDIAVRVLADFFDLAGWRAVHLGANLPPTELTSALQYFESDLLVLSAALTVQLPRVAEAVAAVRRIEGRAVRVMVGGMAFADAPEVWRKVGADGYADDARAAVAMAARLVGS